VKYLGENILHMKVQKNAMATKHSIITIAINAEKKLYTSISFPDVLGIIPDAKYIKLAVAMSIIHTTGEMCTKSSKTLVRHRLRYCDTLYLGGRLLLSIKCAPNL
jgi:hypothetical protein